MFWQPLSVDQCDLTACFRLPYCILAAIFQQPDPVGQSALLQTTQESIVFLYLFQWPMVFSAILIHCSMVCTGSLFQWLYCVLAAVFSGPQCVLGACFSSPRCVLAVFQWSVMFSHPFSVVHGMSWQPVSVGHVKQ